MSAVIEDIDLKCYHCGEPCVDVVWRKDKPFCCSGCETVFDILSSNNLCEYYSLDSKPGVPVNSIADFSYEYLEEASVRKQLLEFDSVSFARITFTVPAIHCISCIWLLENLRNLNEGILASEVNFTGKSVRIDFNPARITLTGIARLLALLGYPPTISLKDVADQSGKTNTILLVKLAVAGFVFGNIMLLSFPEYLGINDGDKSLRDFFSYVNIVLALPVMIFSARDYFINASKSFLQRQVNIDVPIAIGLLALFLRSIYVILTHTGPGFLDSLTGLVFFLLIGRWFQSKTYDTLAFDRDYTAYFPLTVQRLSSSTWVNVGIQTLVPGDRIRIRNMEIVPADSELVSVRTFIDYSFVTGESRPVEVMIGEIVYAGGRAAGEPIELIVSRKTSQGHLTSMWNNPAFTKTHERGYQKVLDRTARRFTWMVMLLAVVTLIVWYFHDPSRMWIVLVSVLMVACPCALALAAPFTYGSFLRVFGKHQFYIKNADVVERLASIDTIVFDKTGTVTYNSEPDIHFIGVLTEEERLCIKTLTGYSTHPLSLIIHRSIKGKGDDRVNAFREIAGGGLQGVINGRTIRIGSAAFLNIATTLQPESTSVFVSIDGTIKGCFAIAIAIRKNFAEMIQRLGNTCYALLSGDHDGDRSGMAHLFGPQVKLLFNQGPAEKLEYIKALQQCGRKVMMIGDGLNDAGALKQSDVGVAVTDDTSVFTPACDAILQGDRISSLDRLVELARSSSLILKSAFVLSFMYNGIALSFAASGHLTPLVAAILMPISSISVVGFSTMAVRYAASKKLKNH